METLHIDYCSSPTNSICTRRLTRKSVLVKKKSVEHIFFSYLEKAVFLFNSLQYINSRTLYPEHPTWQKNMIKQTVEISTTTDKI